MVPLPYPIPANEQQRLGALENYRLLDTPPEEDFDRLAGLASRIFDVPIVLISLIERERQFFKAHIGTDLCETSREVSFCTHAIMQDDILVIPDATKDPRFVSNPLVIGPPFIRFYAGKPLVAAGGEKIGTVCLIDSKPRRTFSAEDRKNLTDLTALVMDRMEMRRIDYVRTISQARFENIAATSPDAIICSNSEGEITFWNRSAEKLFGYSAEEVYSSTSDMLIPDSWRKIYDDEVERLRNGDKLELADQTIELSGRRKDGSEFPAEFSFSTWQEGNTTSVGAIVRDVTERRQNEERLFRLASMDALTDLPNRTAWRKCVEEALVAERPITVMLVDLDGFKDINDSLGHSAGDAVLKAVAGRMQQVCDNAIMVARLGGDEFVALLPGNNLREANARANALVTALSQPYDFAGQTCEIGASIGVAMAPQHGALPEDLLSAADLALYRAKAAGKGCVEVFEPALREVAVARRAFEHELLLAFENGEFELFYQPQVTIQDRRLCGAEALLRWNHPERGLLTPVSFIEVLSRKPSAPKVGEWIMRQACLQAAEWRRSVPDFSMGVNLFEAQIRSGRLLTSVREVLAETGLDPSGLELELVETIFLRNDGLTLRLMDDLHALGVGLAFDDYGTGYASLSMLKRYPVTRIKLDRSFVSNVNVDEEDAAVVRAVLYLGRSFGMEVIAEGIETEAQVDFLMGSTFLDDKQRAALQGQGYLFGKPVPAAEFERKFITPAAAA